MIITVNKKRTSLTIDDKEIACSCVVRNELNGWRKSSQIVYTMPSGIAYMPRTFPHGIWNVSQPVRRTDEFKAPYYIPTDAWQFVDEWIVEDNAYVKPSGRKIKDYAYGLHYSTSGTTLGCIKILEVDELVRLVEIICEALEKKEEVKLIAL